MKKLILCICIFILSISFIGCDHTPIQINSITLDSTTTETVEYSLFTGWDYFEGTFSVDPDHADADDLKLIIDNNDIVDSYKIKKGLLSNEFTYKIKPKYNGEINFKITSLDGSISSKSKKLIFKGGDKNPNETYYIGEIAKEYYYNVEFVITDLINSKHFDNGYGYGIDTDNNFALIEISITNKGNESYYVNPNNFFVNKYENNEFISKFEYSSHTFSFENAMSSDDINYGITKTYQILFELDQSTENGDYRLVCDGGLKSGCTINLSYRH